MIFVVEKSLMPSASHLPNRFSAAQLVHQKDKNVITLYKCYTRLDLKRG